jgi:hypothetical protein
MRRLLAAWRNGADEIILPCDECRLCALMLRTWRPACDPNQVHWPHISSANLKTTLGKPLPPQQSTARHVPSEIQPAKISHSLRANSQTAAQSTKN